MDSVKGYSGATLEELNMYPPGVMDNIEENLGFPYRAFHRVDLHNELKKLALGDDGKGEKVELHLGVKIVRVDVETAEIELSDERAWSGDLLVGADELHSVVRSAALKLGGGKRKEEESEDVGWDINRWLLDTKDVEEDPELKALMKKGRSSFVLPYNGHNLRLVWYSCRE